MSKIKTKAKVLLIEDHPLTRKGLFTAIEAQDDLKVCGEAAGWREALTMIRPLRPDIIVLDLNLKDGSGWELIKQIEKGTVIVPIMVLSVCNEEVFAVRVLKSGAMGYLMKDTPVDGVLEGIRKVLSGHIAVSNKVASHLISSITHEVGKPGASSELDILSNRELQVFEYLRQGLSNRMIAESLGISQKTIATYKTRLMEKLGVRTTPELVARIQSK